MSQSRLLDVDYLDHVVQVVPSVEEVGLHLDLRTHLIVLLDVLQGFDERLDLPCGIGRVRISDIRDCL